METSLKKLKHGKNTSRRYGVLYAYFLEVVKDSTDRLFRKMQIPRDDKKKNFSTDPIKDQLRNNSCHLAL